MFIFRQSRMGKCWLSFLLILLIGGAVTAQKKSRILEPIFPNGLALDAKGELYFSDIGAHRIFKLLRSGKLTLIAGTGEVGFSGDGGAATKAQLNSPHDLLFDEEGNLLIADTGNNRIRRIDRQGIISTIAGDGKALQSNFNGAAPATSLNNPQALALDREGNLLIADTYNHVIRQLDKNGKLTIFVGSVSGFGGDGGAATKAQISLPQAVAVSSDGSVYLSDSGYSRIRRVTPDGMINTIAGYGPAQDTYGGGYGGDGEVFEKAKLFAPTDLKFDGAGNLFISDSGNNRVRVVRGGTITTLAGNGNPGFSGEGKAANAAELNSPQKIVVAKDGAVYISDRANHAIRKIDQRGNLLTVVRGAGGE
jgi:sugar lactone lactonase YvrE